MSYLGDWFNTIAIYTAVQTISGTAQAVAAVMVAKTLPAAFVAPIAGPIIDRFDRRTILIVSDLARAVAVIGLIASHRAGSFAGLIVFTVVMMVFSGFVFPTKSAVLPMVVDRSDIAAANAMSGGTWSIMLSVGAAFGGAATELLGVTAAFVVDGVTFLVSVVFFLGLPRLPPPAEEPGRTRQKATFVDGLRYLRREPYIRACTTLKPMVGLLILPATLIPLVGRWFPAFVGPTWVGLLFAARGAGALTGSMGLRLLVPDTLTSNRRLVWMGYLLAGFGFWMVSVATTYWLVVAGFYISAVGSGAIWVNSGTIIQKQGNPGFHGRVFSMEFGATTAAIALGAWLAGVAVDAGASFFDAALAAALYSLLPLAFWTFVMRRNPVRAADLETPTAAPDRRSSDS